MARGSPRAEPLASRSSSHRVCSARASRACGSTAARSASPPLTSAARRVSSPVSSRSVPANWVSAVSMWTSGMAPSTDRAAASDSGSMASRRRGAAQPVRQGREVAGEQVVDRPAGVGDHGIPLVLPQFVDHEPNAGELVRQDLRVHLVLRGQAIGVDARQFGQPVTGPAAGLLVVRGGAHREPAVVTVIADAGGPLRLAFQQAVEGRRGVAGEGAVHVVCHAPNLRLPPRPIGARPPVPGTAARQDEHRPDFAHRWHCRPRAVSAERAAPSRVHFIIPSLNLRSASACVAAS